MISRASRATGVMKIFHDSDKGEVVCLGVKHKVRCSSAPVKRVFIQVSAMTIFCLCKT